MASSPEAVLHHPCLATARRRCVRTEWLVTTRAVFSDAAGRLPAVHELAAYRHCTAKQATLSRSGMVT